MLESSSLQIRRSHLPEGVKTKKWDDRMQKVKKEQAIKKLQAELKDEKLAEIQRCALSSHHPSSLPRHRLPNFSISFPTDVAACSFPIQTEGDHHGAQDGR